MKPFQKLVKRYGGSAAFVAAATPIPDDLVYIPLGLAKYNPKRFFVATLLGKFVLYYVIVLISHYMGLSLLEPILQDIEDPLPVYIRYYHLRSSNDNHCNSFTTIKLGKGYSAELPHGH